MARLEPKTYLGETRNSWTGEDFHLDHSFYKGGSRFPRHAHANSYFCFVLDGACDEQSSLGHSSLGRRSCVFHASGSHHSNLWHQSGHCMSLEILPTFWDRLEQKESSLPASRVLSAHTADLALKLYDELAISDSASRLVIEANALLIVAGLLRQPVVAEKAPRWLRRAEEILRAEFANPPSLSDVATRVGVHPTHLARSFQKYFGKSLGEYVREVRVEKARILLTNTDRKAGEIGLDLGFSDQSHFNRTFKNLTGFTPKEFRSIELENSDSVPRC